MRILLAYTLLLLVFHCLTGESLAQNRVGIGTTAPAYLLDVQGDPQSTLFVNLNSKVNYTGNLDIRAVEGNSVTSAGYGIGGRFTGGYKAVDALGSGGAYSGAVFGIYSSASGTAGSRYGIYGTASGGTSNYGLAGVVNGGTGYYAIYASNPNVAGYAGYFVGRGHFTEELRADKNMIVDDNLGVGTTLPVARLHIPIGNDASYTTNGFIQTGISNGWNMVIDDNEILARNNGSENDLFIQRDGGDVLLCALELGGVGIGLTVGTSIPTGYMLAVDGKIIAEELRIQNSNIWPDYVFARDYPLMPLEALGEAIRTQRHLPNIPSASEVETQGILIGEMQARMMEKIEELTLYVLDLHETNRRQQEEISELRAMLETQEQMTPRD
jgi:hypothetical protein